VSLIFDRRINRRTPGTWRTRVITSTETVVCNTRDFGIGRRGHRRELESPTDGWRESQPASVRRASRRCPTRSGCGHLHPGDPTIADRRSTRAPALPFGDPRVMAVLAAHRHIPPGVPENGQTESAAAAITLGRTLRRLSALPLNTKSIPERGWPGPGVAVSVGDGSSGNTVTTSVDLCSNDISVLRGVGKHMPEPICG
jgi:hypothetical protein